MNRSHSPALEYRVHDKTSATRGTSRITVMTKTYCHVVSPTPKSVCARPRSRLTTRWASTTIVTIDLSEFLATKKHKKLKNQHNPFVVFVLFCGLKYLPSLFTGMVRGFEVGTDFFKIEPRRFELAARVEHGLVHVVPSLRISARPKRVN